MTKSSKKRRLPRRKRRPAAPSQVDSQASTGQLIANALQLQKAGDLESAKTLYCQILHREPLNPDAWHLLGMTLHGADQHREAIECLQKADAIVPNHPEVLANLGVVYRSMGNPDQARCVLEKSIAADPNSAAARINLGTVLLESSLLDAAEAQFQRALEIDPHAANAAMNLGNVWQKQGRLRDAEGIYRQLLERNAGNAKLLTNLGESLRKQGKRSEAVAVLKQALSADPQSIETALNLARALKHSSRHGEAEELLRQVVRQYPELAKAYHYLGITLLDLGDLDAAREEVTRSVELDPSDVYAISSLGTIYLEMGRNDAALESFRKVIDKDPMMSEAHGSILYIMSADPTTDQAELFEEHRRWGQIHGNLEPRFEHRNVKQVNRPLRIGYVSPDFRNHAVAKFIRPVLQSHDPQRVEVFAYAEVPVPDEMTVELKSLVPHWRNTDGLSNLQVAQQIVADEIDILVDLAGHTSRNRLLVFAHRPAPVQMTWLGYPNTTGLSTIDYRLTCQTQNPIGEPSYHVEELLRIPGGSFCFSAPSDAPDVQSAPVARNGHITFGSLHRPFKISESVRDLWSAVLTAVPDSRMLIFHTGFNAKAISDLRQSLIERGIASDRFEIRNEYDGDSYLETYHEIDIALDVSPWAGGTTTLEALWMGVPVAAYFGNSRSSRSTAAIVKNAGHADWVADSDQQYVRVATDLAGDTDALEQIRRGLRDDVRQSVVDADRFTRELEQTFQLAWNRWCES
ncbi:MAG: tetratricopeptide repeat protein [Pirellulaceae bacterium]|nr:tetratricopeptide repeat protein [Pirellulaceae bacterium]